MQVLQGEICCKIVISDDIGGAHSGSTHLVLDLHLAEVKRSASGKLTASSYLISDVLVGKGVNSIVEVNIVVVVKHISVIISEARGSTKVLDQAILSNESHSTADTGIFTDDSAANEWSLRRLRSSSHGGGCKGGGKNA